jgi:hypothetical protein
MSAKTKTCTYPQALMAMDRVFDKVMPCQRSKIKLTRRHLILLDVIAQATVKSGAETLYFVPSAKGNYSKILRETTKIGGGGDAGILRKFERDGLTENANSSINPYCCRITKKGRAALSQASLLERKTP